MDKNMEQRDGVMGSIRKLIEERGEYLQDITRRTRRNACSDDVMIKIDKVFLADIEWQLDHKKE